MENNPTKEPTFKVLLITQPDGTSKHVPLNRENKQHYTEYGTWLTKAKQEKYKVEEVELTLDEAVAIGMSEAIQIKYPPKQAKQQNNDFMATLIEQNKLLMQLLSQREETKTAKK